MDPKWTKSLIPFSRYRSNLTQSVYSILPRIAFAKIVTYCVRSERAYRIIWKIASRYRSLLRIQSIRSFHRLSERLFRSLCVLKVDLIIRLQRSSSRTKSASSLILNDTRIRALMSLINSRGASRK
jgi:hypothetical protein